LQRFTHVIMEAIIDGALKPDETDLGGMQHPNAPK